MNLFSTPVYLETLAQVRYPNQPWAIKTYEVAGKLFRLLELEGHRPVTSADFLDFFEPLAGAPEGPAQPLAYLPKAVLTTERAEGPPATPGGAGRFPSPFVDWSGFPQWSDYLTYLARAAGPSQDDSRRKLKKLERDLGRVEFVFDDPRPFVFEQCLRWKSAQYRETGHADLFLDPRNAEMLRRLRQKGAVVVSSLSAGSTLAAAHLGGLADNRHYWWVPAYDPAHSRYSPGRLMLERILEESHRRGHAEFDFLIGDEPYKWQYATHQRVIGPLGEAPLSLRLEREAKRRLKTALGHYPRLLELAVQLEKELVRLRLAPP